MGVKVFEGNTADPMTVSSQIEKLRNRFSLERITVVGDRGMLTEARIDREIRKNSLTKRLYLRTNGSPTLNRHFAT